MPQLLSRRELIAGAISTLPLAAMPRPSGLLIDTHIHLFAADRERFPYHKNAPYQPPAADLADYKPFVAQSKVDHVVIVHPEPYQDDHSYLEYCFENEASPGFFKGTCLFDPLAPHTLPRIEALTKKYPGRIVALRVHQMHERDERPSTGGAIKNRDLDDPRMKKLWRKAGDLGMAIQVHFKPFHAPRIAKLAREFSDVSVVLDHLGRSGMGTAADFEEVLKLAELPNTNMKFSGWRYSSKQEHSYRDAKPVVRKAYDAFGPDRMIWGGLGKSMADFDKAVEVFDLMFDFASEADRAKIRGLTAKKLYRF
jgi:predicted TIM-barrel fold metal-dependent hydrolase